MENSFFKETARIQMPSTRLKRTTQADGIQMPPTKLKRTTQADGIQRQLSFIPDNISTLVNELNSVESCRLLKVVDEMREILHQEKVTLPHIVVVGDQSVSIQENVYIFHLYLSIGW